MNTMTDDEQRAVEQDWRRKRWRTRGGPSSTTNQEDWRTTTTNLVAILSAKVGDSETDGGAMEAKPPMNPTPLPLTQESSNSLSPETIFTVDYLLDELPLSIEELNEMSELLMFSSQETIFMCSP
ncbi:hypothetical protein HN873_045330 [Arachis hypogaea]